MSIIKMRLLFATSPGVGGQSPSSKRQEIITLSICTFILFLSVDEALEQQQDHPTKRLCVNSSLQHTPQRQS
jgi:hypothetical protein